MKITVGGSIGYKIMIKQYEPIEVSSSCEIEFEAPQENDLSGGLDEWMNKFNDKATEVIKNENRKRMKVAIEEYREKIERLRKV